MTCMARAGFLTLHDCGNPASSVCASCGRSLCAAHLSPASGFTRCVECQATNPTTTQDPNAQTTTGNEPMDDEYGPDYAYSYRDRYYRDSGYTPHGSSTFDESDTSSFDETAREEGFDGDQESGGYVES